MPDKVKIKVKSTITDLSLAEKYRASSVNGVFRADDGRIYKSDRIDELASDVIEYSAYAEVLKEGNNFIIRYRENPEIGYESCVTSLIFAQSDRQVLTMVRSGEISAAFRFDMREKRQTCHYDTPLIPLEFTINTRSVHNTFDGERGAILLDYKIETNGVNTERNRIFIEIY